MKKIIALACCFFVSTASLAAKEIVNVYNWASYLPPEVLDLFEKETGIHVNYSTFDDNESLYAKLKADPNSGYDVIVPSTYIVRRMANEGMLQKIDKTKLPNFKNMDPKLLNQSYDPNNQYSIPYLWGTTGIVVDSQAYPKGSVKHWKDLWQPRFERKVVLLDDMRDVFSMALRVCGYSINDRNPKHIEQAYLKLKELRPNIRAFVSNGSQQMYINEDAKIGIVSSGDSRAISEENPAFYYVYPKEGPNVWMDNMALPASAKHLENAYRFMDFVMRPDIAKMISMGVGYSSPNLGALKLMPKEIRENRVINPLPEDLLHSEAEDDLGKETTALYLKYWNLLKLES